MGAKPSIPLPLDVVYELVFECYVTCAEDAYAQPANIRSAKQWCSNPNLWTPHLEAAMNDVHGIYRLSVHELSVNTKVVGDHVKGLVSWRSQMVDITALSARILVMNASDIITNGLHRVDGAYRYSIFPIRVGQQPK